MSFGEGDYATTEADIRTLLAAEARPGSAGHQRGGPDTDRGDDP